MLVLSCIWAAFIVCAVGSGIGLKGVLWSAPLSFGPVWFSYRRAKRKQAKLDAYVNSFLTALGHSDERWLHLSPTGSIGVNREARLLALGDGQAVKAYAYADARGWASREETPQRSSSPLMPVSSGLSHVGEALGAAARSGLVVRVRDVDRPEWFIRMDATQRARWMEILEQEIGEGRAG